MKSRASSFLKNKNLFPDFLFNLHQLVVWAEDFHHRHNSFVVLLGLF